MTTVPLASGSLTPARASAEIGPIVVALGGSDVSGVLSAARLFESTAVGGMLAVSVLEPLLAYFTGDSPPILAPGFEEERASGRLATMAREMSDAGIGAGWQTRVVYGDPSFGIASLARSQHAPLIVMGIGRRRPLDRLFGLETAARTIRRATCPVLAVTATVKVPFREAVVATDFSLASISAARAIVPLMANPSVLHLVHVWERNMVDDDRLQALNEAYVASLPAKFAHLRELLSVPKGVTVKQEVREGNVAEHILTFAEARHADVIVAGRHGLGAIERLFVGSVTTTLLHGTTCSVLIAPEPTSSERDSILRRMTGTSESRVPSEWTALLDAFTRRNIGRPTAVEIDDVALGAQVLETGYALQGATYDHHDRCVELMLGDGATRHLTRTIAGVDSVAVYTDQLGRDSALMVAHGPGKTLLTFVAGSQGRR